MSRMKRRNVHLPNEQLERLAHHSKRTGAVEAELIRRAVQEYLDKLDEEEKRLTARQ